MWYSTMIQKCPFIMLLIIFFTDLCKANMDNTSQYDANSTAIERKEQIVKEGSLVRLKCQREHPWFFCLWKSPRNERQCGLNFPGAEMESKCRNDRLVLKTTRTDCDLEMKALPSDHGVWMCFTISKSFGTSKSYVDLEVAVEATLDVQEWPHFKIFQQSAENEDTNKSSDEEKEEVLRIDEGGEKLVTCSARRGFPASQLSWTIDSVTSKDLDDSSQAITKEYFDDHLIDTTQRIKIIGKMEYDNSTLTCWSRQITQSGNVVFLKSSSIAISVHPIGAPLSLNLEPLAVMLLFLLFLIFLCIIFSLFWRWKWNKDEKKKPIENYDTNIRVRQKTYDQNMNKLRLKRELYRDDIFGEDALHYRGYKDLNRYPSVIVSEPRALCRTVTEKDLELHLTPRTLYSRSPTSLQYQISSSNSSFCHKLDTRNSVSLQSIDNEYGKSASNLSLLPPNLASKLSLIVSNSPSKLSSSSSVSTHALNTVISNHTKDDLDNVTVTTKSDLNEIEEAARNHHDEDQHGIQNPAFSPLGFTDMRDSVFYCQEGCFDLTSPCTHIRVAINI